MAIDLHTHTIYSDGGLTPGELVQKAKEIGLSALSIADHDSVSGLAEAITEGQRLGLEVIPAVEVSAYPNLENEYHILGYFINWKEEQLQKELKHFQDVREERAHKIVEKLNNLGYQVTFDAVRAEAKGIIVQPHVAAAIIKNKANKGKLIKEFSTLPKTGDFIREHLIQGKDAYIPRDAFTPEAAIDFIHRYGGLAVLAHPCWNLAKKDPFNSDEKMVFDDQGLRDLAKIGLDGVEVYAHRENEVDTKTSVDHYLNLANELNLVATGGSDFHGYGSAGKKLGFEDFYLKIPDEVLENLKERKDGRVSFL